MRKHKNKIIAGVIIAIVLAFVFWYGGDAPGLRGWEPQPKETVVQTDEPTKEELAEAEKVVSDIPVKEESEPATEENKPQKLQKRLLWQRKLPKAHHPLLKNRINL